MLLDFQMYMLYLNCVCVLKTCFKQINDKSMSTIESAENHNEWWTVSLEKNLFLLEILTNRAQGSEETSGTQRYAKKYRC